MRFLPYENYSLVSVLPPDEILTRIEKNIEATKESTFFKYWSNSLKPYRGEINGNAFTITRNIHYRNSFIPVIRGTVSKQFDGSEIRIKMHPSLLVCVFLFFWLSFWAKFISLPLIIKQISTNTLELMTLLPIGMLLAVYILVMVGFKAESSQSKQFLASLFDAEEL